jgi:hypothetical protein
MGLDLDFFVKVDEPLFVPTVEQLVGMLHLLDKHGLTANHYPSEAENARIVDMLRKDGIIRGEGALCRELKDGKCQIAVENYLRMKGWEPCQADLWIGVQGYDLADFPTPPAKNRYSDYDQNYSNTHMIRLVCNPDLSQSIQADFEKFIDLDFAAGVDYHYYYYLCSHGTMYIHEVEPIKNNYVWGGDPEEYTNSRFIIFQEWAGQGIEADPELTKFVRFFKFHFRVFLEEASKLCGHPVVPDVFWG